MTEELEFKDKAGNRLMAGDYIVYGHALGRCASLQYGKVLGITKAKDSYAKPAIKLKVQGIEYNDNFYEPTDKKVELKLLKPSFLAFPSRVLKIMVSQMPEDVANALYNVKVE